MRVVHNNSPCLEEGGGNRSLAQDTQLQMPPGPYNPGYYAADSDYNPSASDLQHILAHQYLKTALCWVIHPLSVTYPLRLIIHRPQERSNGIIARLKSMCCYMSGSCRKNLKERLTCLSIGTTASDTMKLLETWFQIMCIMDRVRRSWESVKIWKKQFLKENSIIIKCQSELRLLSDRS